METSYKIIGGDGREYGPATLDELKSWIRDGRVASTTQIWRSDLTAWAPASQFTELQSELAQSKAVISPDSQGNLETVGFWPRLGAYLLDAIVMYAVFSFFWSWARDAFHWPEIDPDLVKKPADLLPLLTNMGRQSFVYYALRIFYDVPLNGKFGATLGKLVIGAKIVRLDGSSIGYRLAFLRFFGTILSEFTCYIGYLFVAFRDDKRALHDLIVGTRVIFKR